MRGKLLMSMLLALGASAPVEGGIWDKIKNSFVSQEKQAPPTIRVLIAHDMDRALLEVRGKYNVYDPYKRERLAVRFLGKTQAVHSVSSGLRWGEEFPGVYQLHIVPDSEQTSILVNGIPYRGSIYIYDVGGKVSVVNEVEIEEYLQETLPQKLAAQLSEEALAAAAIVARTDAYYRSHRAKNPYWHVDGRKAGFQGASFAGTNPLIEETVRSTRYMVLSQTGIYEGVLTPFPIEVVDSGSFKGYERNAVSLEEIRSMAERGENAAKILSKFFPEARIELVHPDHNGQDPIAEVSPRKRAVPCFR